MKEEKLIIIKIEGAEKRVPKAAYVKAKTEQLKEFGYPKLTEREVLKQLNIILSGKKPTSIIGMFIEGEIKV